MMLFDGDKGGGERKALLQPLLDDGKVPFFQLDGNLALEDYLPDSDELYMSAVVTYLLKIIPDKDLGGRNLTEEADKSLKEWRANGNKKNSISLWPREFAKQLKLQSAPSKVGIAREYIALMEDVPIEQLRNTKRCITLLNEIVKGLRIPRQAPAPQRVLRD